MLQAPFFVGMVEMPVWQATQICLKATAGDAVIALVAFCVVALVARTRQWILHSTFWQVAGFVLVGQ